MPNFPQTTLELVNRINDFIVNPILALLFTLGLLMFLWGGFEFLMAAQSPTARQTGKSHMFWGLIGMFVMASVYGILMVGLNTFGVAPPNDINLGSWL